MQRLPGHQLKRVFDKGAIRTVTLPYPNPVAAVGGIGKEGMADMLHVRPNLVSTAGFEYAAHQRNGAEALQHLIMRHSGLTVLATRVYGLHLTVAQAAADMAANRARGAGGVPHTSAR